MKPVRCSWVDMQKVRASLSGGKRGDQKSLEKTRCVDQSTISTWKSICDVLSALSNSNKHDICHVENLKSFQPCHARCLARAFRKQYGKDHENWNVEELVEWVQYCEANTLTVEQFDAALKKKPITPPTQDEPCCEIKDLE